MYLTHLKDAIGSNYIGIEYSYDFVSPFLDELKLRLKDDYDVYVTNQQNRDHGSHHITVINVMEYNDLIKQHGYQLANEITQLFTNNIDDIKYMGLGKASKGDNTTYFIVCKSDKLDLIRNNYGLKKQDFHITLGFKWKDVFGVPKDKILEPINNFKDKLREAYFAEQSFEFIKELGNYTYEKDSKIYPIELKNTTATFRIDTNDYITISLINDDYLYITSKWQDEKNKPYLAITLVLKYFQDNE